MPPQPASPPTLPPPIASPALWLGMLLCLAATLAWVEAQALNQPLMITLNAWLVGQPAAGQPVQALLAAGWSGITVMGLGLSMFLFFGLLAARRPDWMAGYLMCLLVGGLLVHLIKHAIDAPRPAAVLGADALHVIGEVLRKRSMPSGHSASGFAFAAVLLLTPGAARTRHALLMPVLLWASLIALSRIAVGAHWPLDVLVGSVLGWLFGGISVVLARTLGLTRWCASRTGQWVLALAWLLAGLAMCQQNTGYPQALALQWVLGLGCAAGALWRMWRMQRLWHSSKPHDSASSPP